MVARARTVSSALLGRPSEKRTLLVVLLAACFIAAPSTYAQAAGYDPPRLANGKPDLQGFWTNASMTPLERRSLYPNLVVPRDVADRIEATRAKAMADAQAPTPPDAPAPTIGPNVVGYNTFWLDGGTRLGVVKGEARSSWITNPENGRIPYSPEGTATFEQALVGQKVFADGPEDRTVGERCLIGFGSTGGPPMLNVGYNNRYQLVQTDDHVVLLVEMNHDTRIVRIDNDHRPFDQWLGDSVGRWVGDTLEVTTRNFRPEEALRYYRGASFYISTEAVVTERLTRWSDDELLYEFEVVDPFVVERAWRGEMTFTRSKDPVLEYACHEGNYAMLNILGGSRAEERAKEAN